MEVIMKMKKLLWVVACLGIATTAAAQQQGIVRTLERPGKPSEYLSGVTINVREYPNAIVSKKGGKFSFTISGKRQGESFTITRVQKKGYSLVDKQLKGRRFAYSSTVPIEIVMVADAQLENDKKRIEDKAYNRAKKDYDQRVAILEKQLNEKTISEREYRERYEELNTNYDNYIQLIDEMAERYATTDYKGLSDINREILECIENAELERADSLIISKGSFAKREQELNNKRELKEKSDKLSLQLQQDIDIELNDLIQDYNNKYTIHAAAYRNDSAAYYLERIVNLSPNDVSMIEKTGDYIEMYLADYQRALIYYQLGLDKLQEQNSDDKELFATFLINLGGCYNYLGEVQKAVECHQKALDIYQQMEAPDSAKIAKCYLGIGNVYNWHDDYDRAREYTFKSLEIYEKAPEKNVKDLSTAYNNLGVLYLQMGDKDKAQEYQLKALEMRERYIDNDVEKADFYINTGTLYINDGNYDKALDYYHKALDVFQRVMGPTHPRTIVTQEGIGTAFMKKGMYDQALEHFQEALMGSEQYYGKENETTVICLISIARIHFLMGEKDIAQQEIQQVIDVIGLRSGSESAEMAQTYIGIGDFLKEGMLYDDALPYYQKAQTIYQTLEIEDYNTIEAYLTPGIIYYWQEQYDKAQECYLKALDISKRVSGEQSSYTGIMLKYVGDVYILLGKKQLALEYLQQALATLEHLPDSSNYESHIKEVKEAIMNLNGDN